MLYNNQKDSNIEMYIAGDHSSAITFLLENTILVNQNFSNSSFHYLVILLVVVVVLLVNISILLWINVKERMLVDKMVTIDCVANLLMIGLLVLAFPIRVWGNDTLCAFITCFRSFTLSLNR